jgi:metal-responsive CopG/Arc/MetJ family transcriptional regulator
MKTFSVIFDEELFDKVEVARDKRSRTDFIRDVVKSYFITESSHNPNINSQNPNIPSQEYVKRLEEEITFLREQAKDFARMMENEQKLRAQKQIMPRQEEIIKKNWWQFWK